MKAAYKWRLQNGLYGYITDEENKGLFIYDLTIYEREYGDGTIVTGSPVNDSAITTIVSRMTKEEYTQLFNTFKEYINNEYPDVQLLDAIYYYNIENDECSASASSLKCYATDIVFESTAVSGEPVSAVVTNVQTDPNTGEELRYRIDFTIPGGSQGPAGPTPNITTTAVTTTLAPELDASVTAVRSGTNEDPLITFNFEIPRGKGIDANNNITVTGVTASTINVTGLTASTIMVKNEITDGPIENIDITVSTNGGWVKLYKATRNGTSVRFLITVRNSGEAYYIEANVGYQGGDAGSLVILNSNPRTGRRIIKFRVIEESSDSLYGLIEAFIQVPTNKPNINLRFNNVQGNGKIDIDVDNIPEDSDTRKKTAVIPTPTSINGIVSEAFVKHDGTNEQFLMGDGSISTLKEGTNVGISKIGTEVTISAEDKKVEQKPDSTASFRPILLGARTSSMSSPSFSNITDKSYVSNKIFVQPSSGAIIASGVTASTINVTGLTASTINVSGSGLTATTLVTKEIKDEVFSATATTTGWWTIYKVPRRSHSVRMHIAETSTCEEFYVEINTGYWDTTATGNIAILNGYIPWDTRKITEFRIVDDVNASSGNPIADIQIFINQLNNENKLPLRFNNIEGPGEFVFEEDNHSGIPSHNYILDLSNGMKSEKFVKNNGTGSQYLMADGSVTTLSAGTNVTINTSSDNTVTISATDMMPIGSIIMWAGETAPNGWLLCDGKTINPDQNSPYANYKGPQYQELWDLIGVNYGTSMDSRRLPDLRQRFPIGFNDFSSRYQQIKKVYDYYPSDWTYDLSTFVDNYGMFKTIQGTQPIIEEKKLIVRVSDFYNISITSTAIDAMVNEINSKTTLFALGSTGGEVLHTLTIDEMPEHFHNTKSVSVMTASSSVTGIDQNSTSRDSTMPNGGDKPHNNMPPYLAINFIIKYK